MSRLWNGREKDGPRYRRRLSDHVPVDPNHLPVQFLGARRVIDPGTRLGCHQQFGKGKIGHALRRRRQLRAKNESLILAVGRRGLSFNELSRACVTQRQNGQRSGDKPLFKRQTTRTSERIQEHRTNLESICYVWRSDLLRRCKTSVVNPKKLTVCREGFSAPARRRATSIPAVVCEERATKREPKRTAALRVAPKTPQGFVAPRSHMPFSTASRLAPWHFGRNKLQAIWDTRH